MKDLKVLTLNADYMPLNLVPLSTISWQKAFKLITEGIAVPLEFYENEWIRTPNTKYKCPSVIILQSYRKIKTHAKWSKFNIKLRDDFRCQYCGKRFSNRALTIDHVFPKAKGGQHSWENSVAACKPCNNKKKDRHDISPMRTPYRPSYFELAKKMLKYKEVQNSEWAQYIDYLK